MIKNGSREQKTLFTTLKCVIKHRTMLSNCMVTRKKLYENINGLKEQDLKY